MRLGLIARADNSGLGIQTWEFYKAMKPDKVMVVDISKLNGNKVYPERFNSADNWLSVSMGLPTPADIDAFLADLDVVFIAEAPYNYHLYARAKELGVKTAVQYNYEFFDWFVHPDWPTPDMLIAPSMWHYNDVDSWCHARGIKHIYLHCPVNREALKPREIRQARIFLHPAGRAAAHDRNGTRTVIEAGAWLRSDAQIIIHFQGEQGLAHQATTTTAQYKDLAREYAERGNVQIICQEFENYADVYDQGDVLILPRRYGGNCLPMNEALSKSMPVVMTDISPNNNFLPADWLIPAEVVDEFTPRTRIDIYEAQAKHLAGKIDWFYGLGQLEMDDENGQADYIASQISWSEMAPKYTQAFEDLIA